MNTEHTAASFSPSSWTHPSARRCRTSAEDLQAMIAQLEHACRDWRRAQNVLCERLVDFDQRRAFEDCGYVSTVEFAEARLGLSRRQAQELLRTGRRLAELPVLRAAFAGGELDWSKVREVARVACPETEAEWVGRARERTARELEREVAETEVGAPPPEVTDDPLPVPAEVQVSFRMATTDAVLVRRAMALMKARTGEADVEPGALLADLCRRVLIEAGGEPGEDAVGPVGRETDTVSEPAYRVVLETCPECRRMTHVGGGGAEASRVEPAEVAAAACDAEQVEMRGERRGHIRQTVPPAMRRAVLHRDGYRCVVPGCRNALWLHLHHVVPVAEGGPTREDNLVVVCGVHHRAVHRGDLRLVRADAGWAVERMPAAEEPEGEALGFALEVLESCALDTRGVAGLLGIGADAARRVMAWCAWRGAVTQTVDGRWMRVPEMEEAVTGEP